MKFVELDPIRDLLVQAYGTSMGSGSKPETEQDIENFEQKYQVKLPAAYRALLLELGACNFGDPALYSVKELDWAYPEFLDAYREYEKEYDLPGGLKLFPIGGFGEGSIAVLDESSGKVLMLVHDCGDDIPLVEIESDFCALMTMHAESAIWVEEQMK
ncbi:SMI1/KNR4 family protein [Paenibacillus cucumis (ex Kampfer et al. 2016)]|uniref:SMI1/KNR4 family protein n=1 Tax=Paenibacillus cucumis (ex Kampfer et al. 2016) TaxID=1776858 RepID=A0ABS7KL40_9BACL|nr:SMI1/KNR4 family protein [Paenibacillus cucumis (ex Kampfer et al. 2016)]MBY0204741.1 SMI1/KNR4 family protein [Paenibacillus cucumis (ex Kampfer et al. 2016)]